jgi:hypothetical protein
MKYISTKLASSLLLALGTCAGGLANADTTYTYTYDYNWSVPNSCVGSWLSSCSLSGGNRVSNSGNPVTPADPNAPPINISSTATGWANTGGSSSTLGNQTLEQGQVQAWSGTGGNGLGILNNDSTVGEDTGTSGKASYDSNEGSTPEHAVDNNQRYDSMLYTFNSSIVLTDVMVSYTGGSGYQGQTANDSDIIVLAYTGSDPWNLATKLAGKTYANLVNLGWQLIGNYTNLVAGTSKDINEVGASSSYWLIGAANTLVTGGANDSKSDYIKLAGLGGTVTTSFTKHDTPGVPEPGSLALLGLGSLILVRARAKKN